MLSVSTVKPVSALPKQARGATGIIFFAAFGLLWLLLGLHALLGMRLAWMAPVFAAGGLLFSAGLKRIRQAPRPGIVTEHTARLRRGFRLVNTVQWVACIGGAVLLTALREGEWIVPSIMLIVGLHFFPLARLFARNSHYVTGAALSLLAVTYPFTSPQGPLNPYGPILAGLILWASALYLLRAAAAE